MQEHPYRGTSSLLFLPKLNSLVYLNMQTSHDLTCNLGKSCLMWIIRLSICTSQTDQTLLQFNLFSLRESHLSFGSKFLSNRIGTNVNSAEEKFLTFKEQYMSSLGTDIQYHRTVFKVMVAVSESINYSSLSRVDHFDINPMSFSYFNNTVCCFTL